MSLPYRCAKSEINSYLKTLLFDKPEGTFMSQCELLHTFGLRLASNYYGGELGLVRYRPGEFKSLRTAPSYYFTIDNIILGLCRRPKHYSTAFNKLVSIYKEMKRMEESGVIDYEKLYLD